MDRERGFNFKLLVPPRVLPAQGQVSTIKPHEIVENSGCFTSHLKQQGYNTCFDKEPNMQFPSMNTFVPAKPTKSDVFKAIVAPQMEKDETNCKNGQLYSKLFDEVQKVKFWKVKVDSEAAQKDRKLQENKRTIETQRKAIQELQFGNESLSIKLEDQLSENEDLQNKNNATRNLCNILKDAFERSAEKIHLFESEREETHQLFMDNSENIQRMIGAFENLRIQAEMDRQEMLKIKGGLQEFEALKETFDKEFNTKQEEIVVLQITMKNKEKELQEFQLKFHEIQESCKRLQEEAKQHQETLQISKKEQKSLFESLQRAEQLNKEFEESRKAIMTELEHIKTENAKVIAKKDACLEELKKLKDQQADKLLEIQATAQEFQTSLTVEIQRTKELELELNSVSEELNRKNIEFGEIKEQKGKKDNQLQFLKDELDVKTKLIQSLDGQIKVVEIRTSELTTELEVKNLEIDQCKGNLEAMSTENLVLKTALEEAKHLQIHSIEKANMTESKIHEIEAQLLVAMKREETSMKDIKKLKADIVQHEVRYEELSASFSQLQLEKKTILEQSQNESLLVAQLKESEAIQVKLKQEVETLLEEKHNLREELNSLNARVEEQGQETKNLQKNLDERCEDLQNELSTKDKHMKALEAKLSNLRIRLESKTKVHEECQKESKTLRKQIKIETAKSSELENEINKLKEESEDRQRSNEEERKRLLDDLETKSSSEADLHKKVENLKITTKEALKSKEDAEMKCQNKITDIIALMEKHKKQYEKMVEEKDAELNNKKKNDVEAITNRTSLELELSQKSIENDHLKEQLEKEIKNKETLHQEVKGLKKEIKSLKMTRQMETQLPEPKSKEMRCSEMSTKRPVFRFTKEKDRKQKTPKASETPLQSSDKTVAVTPNSNEITNKIPKTPSWSSITRSETTPQKETECEPLKTPSWHSNSTVSATPWIKSYRVRTPPSLEKSVSWGKSALELDPASDSSEHNDLLNLAVATHPFDSSLQPSVPAAQHHKMDLFRKSPAVHKSPGSALKLAAMKRMRDAGWTAVTAADKKKKKALDKIFA